MWVLKTADDAEPPFMFRILPGSIKTVGRAARADFIVDAALVSRLHCRLTAGGTELEVVDLESTNGTFVNGERTGRAILKNGDRLGVGRVELLVDLEILEFWNVGMCGEEISQFPNFQIARPRIGSSAAPARSSSSLPGPTR